MTDADRLHRRGFLASVLGLGLSGRVLIPTGPLNPYERMSWWWKLRNWWHDLTGAPGALPGACAQSSEGSIPLGWTREVFAMPANAPCYGKIVLDQGPAPAAHQLPRRRGADPDAGQKVDDRPDGQFFQGPSEQLDGPAQDGGRMRDLAEPVERGPGQPAADHGGRVGDEGGAARGHQRAEW